MATGIGVSMTGRHERHVMGECQDLPVGFVGIRSEKSISVKECDSAPPLRPKSHEASKKGNMMS